MKRLGITLWARLRCNCYLLFWGMWRGERRYTIHYGWRLMFLAASTGSMRDGTLKITRTFFSDGQVANWQTLSTGGMSTGVGPAFNNPA